MNLGVLVVDFAVALYLGLVSLPIVRLILAVLPWQFTDWIGLWCIGRLFTKYSVLHKVEGSGKGREILNSSRSVGHEVVPVS